MKTCRDCNNTKKIELFPSDGRGGKRVMCKDCYNAHKRSTRKPMNDHNKWLCKQHRINNMELYRYYRSQRRAREKKASIEGFEDDLKYIYLNCPEGYEVDHIVPLRGKNVSGLHVPWNLQYLTRKENRSKSNKY